MDDLSKGVDAAVNIAKAAPGVLESLLSTLDRYDYLPMSDRRTKNKLDKAALEQRLEKQQVEHSYKMEIAKAQIKNKISLMNETQKLALEAAKNQIDAGIPFEQAYQECLPCALRATGNLFINALEGDYAAERIGLYAAINVADKPDEKVAEGETSKTWMATFWDYARGVRDEEAMLRWGKLLASEVKQPSKFSLRTLDVLRTFDSSMAHNFNNLAKYVFSSLLIPIYDGSQSQALKKLDTTVYDVGMMASCGLLLEDKSFTINTISRFTNHHYIIEIASESAIQVDTLALTSVGNELYSITSITKEDSLKSAEYFCAMLNRKSDVKTKIIEINN